MAIVVFDAAEFLGIYPEFSEKFTEARLRFAFEVACQVADNTERSRIPYHPPETTTRKTILYLLVCHICALYRRGTEAVGTMNSAAEGSVNLGFATLPPLIGAQWFSQTQCGLTAWQLLSGFTLGGRLFNGCFR